MNIRIFDKAWRIIFNSDLPDVVEIRCAGIIYTIYPCNDNPKKIHIDTQPIEQSFTCDIDESAGMSDAMPH